MITGEPFPRGVICNIYCPWCALSALMAPLRLRLLCVRCGFLDQQIQGKTWERFLRVTSPPAGWRAAQEPCLWSAGLCIMEQSVSIAHKRNPFPRQEVQAIYNHEGHRSPLFAIWSEAHIVPSSVGVCLCLCSRVSNISTECRHMQAWMFWMSQRLKSVKPCTGLLG